eukprot:m.43610 g.43610  ORF g.43610 m.43610 type:complete len:336 (-) comp6165_c0_seq1:97-1104(-)
MKACGSKRLILTDQRSAVQPSTNMKSLGASLMTVERKLTLIGNSFVPNDVEDTKSASLTLAYAYDDWAVGNMAKALGRSSDAQYFQNRSSSYKTLWEQQSSYFCPRSSDKAFHCQENPEYHSWIAGKKYGFCEGNQAEYRWFVPHDVDGLVSLFSSPSEYISNLEEFFEKTTRDRSTFMPNPYYWAGNEPDLLEPFQFNFAGRSDLTQKYARWVIDDQYSNEPHGVPGNDDFGALSSWFVWANLGLYPLPGNSTYIVSSPVFPNATIHFEDGKRLSILGQNATPETTYASKVSINGAAIDMQRAFVQYSDLRQGGELVFAMSTTGTNPCGQSKAC